MIQDGPPGKVQAVVVGGGIIGCSVAYHLADMGFTDVVLLERDRISSGTTWHAAGLMTAFGSLSETSISMRKYARSLYGRLEQETGQATGFKQVGFIEIAADRDRLEEYRRVAAFNRWHGIDVEEIAPSEVKTLFPYAKVDDIEAGFYVPQDGRINPSDVTAALLKGARSKGVQVIEQCPVTKVLTSRGRATGVVTALGNVDAQYVINCTGMWARQFGEMSGVTIPNQAAEHYYLLTEQIEGMPKDLPVLEDPSCYGYYREEVGGMMVGLFEPDAAPWKVDGIPADFSFGEIPPDWDRITPFLDKAMSRVPILRETGIRKLFCGPESFTPDLRPILGEAPELRNYFVAAGLNSVGILSGGGIGRVLAHWIVKGEPDVDVTGINIDRFQPYQNTPDYRRRRSVEALGLVYQCHYPNRPFATARNAKRSPLHERLAAKGAYFRDISGWETPDWYAPDGQRAAIDQLSWGRESWFAWWQAEHEACRRNVVVMDMSFMSKFLVQGHDAGSLLDHLSTNKVNGACHRVTYTQWLNASGRLEADLTVIKLSDERFIVVATDTMHRHVESWITRHIPENAHVFVNDVTSAYAMLTVQGPRSREVLQKITSADLASDRFPFRTAGEIDIGMAVVLCARMTYVGELGYELYIPTEQAVHVYERIMQAGEEFGLRHAGIKALGSLRLEKAYRDYGHDIDNTDNPWDVGLGFAVRIDTDRDFIGKRAALETKARWRGNRRLVQVRVRDPEPMLHHGEIVLCNGRRVGNVRSGSYGHTLGGAVGLAFVELAESITDDVLRNADWQVDIAGILYPADLSLRPLYDPELARVRN
jgi:4-methylaminobutanoate oxidase (formaldehyde-forming)